MSQPSSPPKPTSEELAHQLAGIKQSLVSLARAFGPEDPAGSARHQLKWAAIHLHSAVQALLGGEPADPRELPSGTEAASPAPEETGPAIRDDFAEGLRGQTRSISIAEILGFISSLRKSGTLVVHGPGESFLVELKEGAVVYAQGDSPPKSLLLGEILVAQGAISPGALEGYLEGSGSSVGVLGRGLLEEGLISEEALRIALAFQVQHTFHRLNAQDDAYYQFEEGVSRIEIEDIRLNVIRLLLESARTRDETELEGAEAPPT